MKRTLRCCEEWCALVITCASVHAQNAVADHGQAAQDGKTDGNAPRYAALMEQYRQGKRDVPFLRDLVLSAPSQHDSEAWSRAYDIARDVLPHLPVPYSKEDWQIIKIATHTPKDAGFELLRAQAAAADVALGPYVAEHVVRDILLYNEIEPHLSDPGAKTDWDALADRLERAYGPLGRGAVYERAMTYSEEHEDWIPFGKYFALYLAHPSPALDFSINKAAFDVFLHVNDPQVLEVAIRAQKFALDSRQDSAPSGARYLFFVPHSFDDARAVICDADNRYGEALASTKPVEPGSETHVAVVIDNKTITLYLNGAPVKQTALTTQRLSALSNDRALLGASLYPSDPTFNGSINEFRIYNVAADADQIQASYRAGPNAVALIVIPGAAKAHRSLVHRYSFNDGTANDSVGHANGKTVGAVRISEGQALFGGADGERIELLANGPGGINLNGFHALTLEAWFTAQGTIRPWERIFDFGTTVTPADPNAVDTYGQLLYKAGRVREAIEWEGKAVRMTAGKAGDFVATLAAMKAGKPPLAP